MKGDRNAELPRFQRNVLYPADAARILAAVRAAPGSTLRALSLATALHPNVVRGHTRAMARQGKVVLRRLGSRILVYPAESAPGGRRAVAADIELRQAMQRRLLAFIAEHPGLRQTEILETTKSWHWPRATAQHRLNRLVEAHLVKSDSNGREKRYWEHNGK